MDEDQGIAAMLARALAARANAHAAYSGFQVGACLRGDKGGLYAGCNVENAAYPQSQCAEAGAISALVAAGETRIVEVLVVAGGPALISPCGGCRQRLAELAGPTVPVHLCDLEGRRRTVTMGELLPFAFTAASFRPA
ncbi:MAG: cytidine deaminase [Dongiaceae bacterium]